MVRTFEQKNLIEEGKFINTDGVYMVFEGFCGFYEQKKAPVIKINAFGKEILQTEEDDEENKEAASIHHKKTHLDQVMLCDAKVGTLVGIESHLYDDCPACFTAKSNEKTKLLFIDKAGFDKYFKDFILERQRRILDYYQESIFL